MVVLLRTAVSKQKSSPELSQSLLILLQGNSSEINAPVIVLLQTASSDEYVNPVLQSLCADALISISDDDSDWELNITEFMRCLDPGELENINI